MSRPNVTMLYSAVVQCSDNRGRHRRSQTTTKYRKDHFNWAVTYGGESSCVQNFAIAKELKSFHLK